MNKAQSDNELTLKLINIFVENNQDKYAQIKNAIDTGDIKLAHRLTHSLKSNAGQLGKTLLQQIADEIESSLKNGANLVTPQQLDLLEKELNSAMAEFMPLVRESQQQTAAKPAEPPLDKIAALKLLEEVECLLRDKDTECLAFIANLRQIPGSEELIRRIESFDFTLAINRLADLKRSI